tara:strand:+ start:8295 stop:8543 length:249 start_codon:yes stop_codon:yes gene_type:complete
MKIPKAPLSASNQHLHKTLSDVTSFLDNIFQNGTGMQGFTQTQINTMTQPEQAGKTVFNETTGIPERSEINTTTKAVTWKAF